MAKLNLNNIKFVAAFGTAEQIPDPTLPEIAFVGKSNVGKSSLINKLCNNKNLAKVSSQPGKTTTINFFDAGGAYIVDLPGYGYAKRSKNEKLRWSSLIEEYFNQDRNFALVVSLLDIRHDPTDLDVSMIEYLHELGLPFAIVFTKADKLSKQQQSVSRQKIMSNFNFTDHIPVYVSSAEKNIGITEIKTALQNVL